MARLNLKAIEERVAPLGGRDSYDREFIFELLLAYGKPQGNVTRLRGADELLALGVRLQEATAGACALHVIGPATGECAADLDAAHARWARNRGAPGRPARGRRPGRQRTRRSPAR